MAYDFEEFITEYGSLGVAVCRHFGGDVEQARAAFAGYAGEYYNAADFAECAVRQAGEVPASLAQYIDWQAGEEVHPSLDQYIDWTAFARDMVLRGDIMVFRTGRYEVHVFWVIMGEGK